MRLMVCLAVLSMVQMSLQAVTLPPFECTTCGEAKVANECENDNYDGTDDCRLFEYGFDLPQFDYNFKLVTSDEDASTYNCTVLTITCSGYGGVVLYGTGWNFEDAVPVSTPVATDTSSDMSQLLTVESSFLCLYNNYVPKTQLSHVPTIKYEAFLCKVMETEPPETETTPETPSASTPTPSTPSTLTPSTPTQSTSTPTTGTLVPTTTTKCCPLKGIWSDWDEVISPCSDTCGGCGTMTRRRRCLSQSYGCKCTGPVQQKFPCAHKLCLVPRPSCCPSHPKKMINNVTKEFYCGPLAFGEVVERTTCCDPAGQGWNLWAAWSPPCPETCGNCGLRTRSRTCASEKYGCPCRHPNSDQVLRMRIPWLAIVLVAALTTTPVVSNKAEVVNSNPQQPVNVSDYTCTGCGKGKIAEQCWFDYYDRVDECHEDIYHSVDPQFEYSYELVYSPLENINATFNCSVIHVTCSGYGEVVLYAAGMFHGNLFIIDKARGSKSSSNYSTLLTVEGSYVCSRDKKYYEDHSRLFTNYLRYEEFICKAMFITPPTTPSTPSPSTPTPSTPTPSTPTPSTPSTPSTPTPSTPSTPTPSTPTPSTPTPSTPTLSTGTLAPTTSTKCCPLKGIWSDWDEVVSPCSDTCGGCGTMTRKRRCLSQSYGCMCTGPIQQTFPCAHKLCQVPRPSCCPSHPEKMINEVTKEFYCGPLTFGETVERTTCCDPAGQGWNLWAAWSPPCPETCGNCGLRTRSRTCASEKYGCPCKGNREVSMHCSRPTPCVAPKAPCCPPSTLKRVNGTNKCVF